MRLFRSWWTLSLPFAAVGFLMLWHFASGWAASLGAFGCLVCLVILLMVATIGRSQLDDALDDGSDAAGDPEDAEARLDD